MRNVWFCLRFSIPFALFALFPTWLNQLPKSGGWLEFRKKEEDLSGAFWSWHLH